MNAFLSAVLREVKGFHDVCEALGEDLKELSLGPHARFCTSATLAVALADHSRARDASRQCLVGRD
jgi:hypothetical protein